MAGMGAGAMMLPIPNFANAVDPARMLEPFMAVAQKKELADVALNTAKSLGATYTDVRIGRYLNQFVTTREKKVQNVANTESFGAGVRVIVNGTWGFAASNIVTADGIKKTTERAVAIAKANSKFQKEPVRLAATAAYGEVSWKTPIKKNGFEVPIKEKVELLLNANAKAMEKGASFSPQSSGSGSSKWTIWLSGLAICASRTEWSRNACDTGASLITQNPGLHSVWRTLCLRI